MVAGMHHEVVGADRDGTFDLTSERRDGRGPNRRLAGSKIDEIAVVNHQWCEVELLASGFESFDIRGIRPARSPCAGTGGEDLKAIRAGLMRLQRRPFEGTGFRSAV